MKIVFALTKAGYYFRHFEYLGDILAKRGHEVIVLSLDYRKNGEWADIERQIERTSGITFNRLPVISGYSVKHGMCCDELDRSAVELKKLIKSLKNTEILARTKKSTRRQIFTLLKDELAELTGEKYLSKKKRIKGWLPYFRIIHDVSVYFQKGHPCPHLSKRIISIMPPFMRFLVDFKVVQYLLGAKKTRKVFRAIELLIPPDPMASKWLAFNRPDLVLVSPYIFQDSEAEFEFLKASRQKKVLSAMLLASWDNLNIKGTFKQKPKRTFLWNETLASDAKRLHDIPRASIVVTGAPTFDYLFKSEPTKTKDEFFEELGIPSGKKYLLYLCSSAQIAGDETGYMISILEAMKKNEDTKDIIFVARPHPRNVKIFENFNHPDIIVYPRNGENPIDLDAHKNYTNSLDYAIAVMGVNTSGFLDAVIRGKPCLSYISEQYEKTQKNIGHFRYLVEANIINMSFELNNFVSNLANLVNGVDSLQENRESFINSFLRPRGRDKMASEVLAEELIEFYNAHRQGKINKSKAHEPPSTSIEHNKG